MLIGTLQEMQVWLRRMESKQSQMQSCLDELKEMLNVNQEASFKIKGSPFQVSLVYANADCICDYNKGTRASCLPSSCDQCG